MKTSIFLLGTILVAAPYAIGQNAPVAVKVPVPVADAATAPDSDAALQAKIDLAAQALAKLPANMAGLVAAQERVTKAGAMIVVPVGFSLGQSARQAHLVVDNLRSARVWCQTSAKTAKAGDRILLNAAIELLQSAELSAQQKVEILEKPNTATWEELRSDSVRLLEESNAFLKGVDEREAAREAKLIKLRDEGIETERKLQEIRTGLAALPKPLTPEEQQKEAQEREKRRQELEKFLRVPSPELAAALKAESDSSKEYLADSTAFALKIQESFELRKQLNQNGLSDEQKKQIRAKIAVADEEKAQAKQKSKASFDRLKSLQEKINQLRQPAVTEKIGFVRPLKSSLSRSCPFRLVQNAPPTNRRVEHGSGSGKSELGESFCRFFSC